MSSARIDWESRIGIRTGTTFSGSAPRLDPPSSLLVIPGGHQVTVSWASVEGAVGYQVHVADGAYGPWEPLDHSGRDVLAVPHPPYVDTTGTPGTQRWYAVSALSDVHVEGPRSQAVAMTPLARPSGPVTVSVDAATELGELDRPWRPMIGSEHLSHALIPDTIGGRPVGEELSSALRAAHDELGGSSRGAEPSKEVPVRMPIRLSQSVRAEPISWPFRRR